VIATQGLAPVHERLLERCQELNLDDNDTKLLEDLLGWNNQDCSLPRSHWGLAPYFRFLVEAKGNQESLQEETAFNKAIVRLLHTLLGDRLISEIEREPVQTLEQLGLPRSSIVWLVVQLELQAAAGSEIAREIEALREQSLEDMRGVVGPALYKLLAKCQR
jgi:hypothetical protein